MKCSEKVMRYEHKNIIVVVEEKLPDLSKGQGGQVIVQFHKRSNVPNESHWKGSLDEIRELSEAVFSTLVTLTPEPEVSLPDLAEAMDTLNAGEGLRAEPPNPGEGDMVIQMTIEQFRDILDVSNDILTNPSDKRSSKLALMVNKAFGGKTIY